MTEWRNVEGWPYEVSRDGQVRRHGSVRILRGIDRGKRGYLVVGLREGRERWRQVFIHVLVCEAFHGPRPSPIHQVGHRDGSKDNNHADNLRWVTPKENAADRDLHDRTCYGLRNKGAKYPPATVRAILASPLSALAASKHFGVSRTQVRRIRAGICWRRGLDDARNAAAIVRVEALDPQKGAA